MSYNGAIGIGAGFYSNTSKPIIDAKDVYVDDNNRLSDILEEGINTGIDKRFGVDGSSLVGKELFHLDFEDNFDRSTLQPLGKDAEPQKDGTYNGYYIVNGDARSIYSHKNSDNTYTPMLYIINPKSKDMVDISTLGLTPEPGYAYYFASKVNEWYKPDADGFFDYDDKVYYNRTYASDSDSWINSTSNFGWNDKDFILVPIDLVDKWFYTNSYMLFVTFEGVAANSYSMKRTGNFDHQGLITGIEYYESSNKSKISVTNIQPITNYATDGIDLWLHYQPLAGDFSESLGAYAVGSNNIVSGFNGFAAGFNNRVLSDYGVATGRENIVTYGAQAHGRANIVEGQWAVALGQDNKILDQMSFAAGRGNTVTKPYGSAIGYKCTSSGAQSTAIGHTTTASGAYAFTTGYQTKAEHSHSAAFGSGTKTGKNGQVVIGNYNEVDTGALFVIGNGGSASSPRNIFTVSDAEVKATGNITGSNMYITSNGSTEAVASKNYVDSLNLNHYSDRSRVVQKGCSADASNNFAFGYDSFVGTDHSGSLGLYNTSGGYGSVATGRANKIIGHDYRVSALKIKSVTVSGTTYNAFVDAADNYLAAIPGKVVIAYNNTYKCYIPVTAVSGKDGSNNTFYYIAGNYDFTKSIYAYDAAGTTINSLGLKGLTGSTFGGAVGAFACGSDNIVFSSRAGAALGQSNIIGYDYQTVVGVYNDPTSNAYFMVGGGNGDSSRRNIFTVDRNGDVSTTGVVNITGSKLILSKGTTGTNSAGLKTTTYEISGTVSPGMYVIQYTYGDGQTEFLLNTSTMIVVNNHFNNYVNLVDSSLMTNSTRGIVANLNTTEETAKFTITSDVENNIKPENIVISIKYLGKW